MLVEAVEHQVLPERQEVLVVEAKVEAAVGQIEVALMEQTD
jgi:hypothetical protein